ncbi:MAG: hypothetical protein AAFU71_13780 [Cyanobacteria bacterium J06632_22]
MLPLISPEKGGPDVMGSDAGQLSLTLTDEDRELLPPQFLSVAKKLNQNYRYWRHLRATQQATQATFYLFARAGMAEAANRAAEAGQPMEQPVLLILETNLALATVNALLLASEDYLQRDQLQNCKDSIDTALSTLYEFIDTRTQLSQSRDIAVNSIQQDVSNDEESAQYVAYGLKKLTRLQRYPKIEHPNRYVVRQHLQTLKETFTSICPQGIDLDSGHLPSSRRVEALLSNIFIELTQAGGTATSNGANVGDDFNLEDDTDAPSVIFSPGGSHYLHQIHKSSNEQGTNAKVVETKTGEAIQTIAYEGRFTAMSFSNDGQYLAVVHRDAFEVIDVSTGEGVGSGRGFGDGQRFMRHQGLIRATQFSPDGDYLAVVNQDNDVKIVQVSTRKTLRSFSPRRSAGRKIQPVCFSSKGTYLAQPDENGVRVFAIATAQEITSIPYDLKDRTVEAVCFSPDESHLATYDQGRTRITNLSTGEVVIEMTHQGKVQAISTTPFGTYLAISLWDHTVKLIKVMSKTGGAKTYTIRHRDTLNTAAFSAEGAYLATAASDNRVTLIKVATSRKVRTITHGFNAIALSFAANRSFLASAATDGGVKLFELPKLIDAESESENLSDTSPVEETALVRMDKAEVFFRIWRLEQANASSFYEFMLTKAAQSQNGLAARYKTPILEVNLLLEALFFLLKSAEQHYQAIAPYLADLDNGELTLPALQDLKDTVSAALSSLYEFIHSRMTLDDESYTLAVERFQLEAEGEIYTSQLLITIYEKVVLLLRFEGIKRRREFYTVKKSLDELFSLLGPMLPEEVRQQRNRKPQFKTKVSVEDALRVIGAFKLEGQELVTLLKALKQNGALNGAIALAALSKVAGQTVIDLAELLPAELIDKTVALVAIRRYRKTHYIGTLLPWTQIEQKAVLLKILENAPPKTWWRR